MARVRPQAAEDGVEDQVMGTAIRRRLFGDAQGREPVRIGRFVVVRSIGEGGMGTVYQAYDADLDRWVAVKLLRGSGAGTQAQARMVREAQALARLSHPNVVTVHEVGTLEVQASSRVFVAMEFVPGSDLAAWSRAHPPGGRARFAEAVELLLQAGTGLAAAHAAGLVHRDFKPSNVLVGQDGRVRVADFGLARTLDASVAHARPPGEGGSSATPAQTPTRTGIAVGTPAYMAPEQRDGREVDARTDQFAFCVSAWEVLYGERPSGPADPAHGDTGVPAWVRPVLARGLREDADERHGSMDELLAALRRDPTRARRRLVLGAVGLLALGGAAAAYANEQAGRCSEADAPLVAAWNPGQRQAIVHGLASVPLPAAPSVAEQVDGLLDDYSARWSTASHEVCEAWRRRGALTRTEHERATGCLQDRVHRLASLTAVLADADEAVVRRATLVAAGLPPPENCVDPALAGNEGAGPDDPALAHRATQLRRLLLDAATARSVGRFAQAQTQLDGVVARAEESGLAALRAEAILERGRAKQRQAHYDAARTDFEDAYWLALRRGEDRVASRAAIQLVSHFGGVGEYERGLGWARYADALVERAGSDPTDRANAMAARARISLAQGDSAQAQQLLERVLELGEQRWGKDHPQTAGWLTNLGAIYGGQGRYEEAIEVTRRAYESERAAYGDQFPGLAGSLNNLGNYLGNLSRFDEARDALTRALEHTRRWQGADHPRVGAALANLGLLEHLSGDPIRALERFREARAVYMVTLAPTDPRLLRVDGNIAEYLMLDSRCDEAMPILRSVLEQQGASIGPAAADSLVTRGRIAGCHLDQGSADTAVAELTEVVEQWREHPQDDRVYGSIKLLARAEHLAGDTDAARRRVSGAVERLRHEQSTSSYLPELLYTQAQLLMHAEPARAAALADEALALAPKRPDGELLWPAWLLDHATVLHATGHADEAQAVVRRALKRPLSPSDKRRAERALAGDHAMRVGKPADAEP